MIDPFSNLLSAIKIGLLAKRLYVDIPRSRRLIKFILFFIKQGYICGVQFPQHKTKGKFRIFLKYYGCKPVISGIVRMSKPSRRIYLTLAALKRLYSPYILFVLSTPRGYINGYQALNAKIGGELICLFY